MTVSFPTRAEYEALVYSLPQVYPAITSSTLRLYSTSALTAIVEGEVNLNNGLSLRVFEVLDFKAGQIRQYSYTVYRGAEKIRWYDPQPHPEVAALAATFPHHFHEAPDIKHHRLPAPGISFTTPNVVTLIAEVLAFTPVG